jgi:hypothetical protein
VRARSIVICSILTTAALLAGCVVLASPFKAQDLPIHDATAEAHIADGSVVYTAAKEYRRLAWVHGGERFPAGATLMIHDARGNRELPTHFAAAADPNGSFDGKSILFSGKQHESDPWQAWELNLSDNKLKRLTQSSDDIIRPLYLPSNRIAYARKSSGRFVLEALSLRDETVIPLSYAPGNYVPTDVLRDGRVLFESTYPLGTGSVPEIYTVYSDGTGVEAYRCDHGPARFAGRELSSGDIVFPTAHGLARFTSPLAHQVAIETTAGDFAGDVEETAAHEWLLAWRRDAKQPYEIREWDTSSKTLKPLLSQPGMNLVQPVVIAPRTVPNRHPSTLRDWTAANLLTLDAYTSKHDFKPGSIATVRVYTVDSAGRRKVLGSAPVEKDGSLYVHVPGDVPLQFELLSSTGKILQKESGWMWTRKSEQRICVGCHAGPEHAPENAVPAVLLRSIIPKDLTTPLSTPPVASGKGAD